MHDVSKYAHISEVCSLLADAELDDLYRDEDIPTTSIESALNDPHANEWRSAFDLELKQIEKYKIWTKVSKPAGSHVVGTKWVFKIDTIDKFRARLVIKGYAQVKGLDYTELFSPVISFDVMVSPK